MNLEILKLKLRNSKFQGIVFFPLRLFAGLRYLYGENRKFVNWLFKSSEHTNYTYELTSRNIDHLAWFVSNVTNSEISDVKRYFDELILDQDFNTYLINQEVSNGSRKYDSGILKIGRRLAWYAIVRALKPRLVVETGTDKGLGSLILAQAVVRNGSGKVITIDINPKSGQYIDNRFIGSLEILKGDSVDCLNSIDKIDVFLHDSNHSADHELAELNIILEKMNSKSLVMSDNGHATDSLSDWCKLNNYQFNYFQEVPKNHWYKGASLSVAKNW